jgi:rhamnosyltransferase
MPTPDPLANPPKVSVIMRTKNADDVVGQALAGLFAQTFRDFELIVVDSGSTDRTLDIVRQHAGRLIEIPASSYVPGPVLNMAIAEARGEIVVFQNSDVVPLTPQALARLVAPFVDPSVQATFARQRPRPEAHTWVRRDYDQAYPAEGPGPEWQPYSLPFAAMRKSLWRTRPFWDASWGSEDTEWGYWARRNGHRVEYVADSLVMHSHNYTLRQLYGRRFIEGESDAVMGAGHGSAIAVARAFVASVARDVLSHLRARDLAGFAMILPRRAVYHWAWIRGFRHGASRLRRGDTDVSVGQQAVLSRYEA